MRVFKLLLLLLLVPAVCLAKGPKLEKETIPVEFMGVDFSCVDVVGADESVEAFQKAFQGINTLYHTEPKKYKRQLTKIKLFTTGSIIYLLDVKSVENDYAVERVSLFDDNPITVNKAKETVESIISTYPSSEGYKVLIVATELNKAKRRGYYTAVLYDGQSKEIISTREMKGLAGGAGLRNYWAYSLYTASSKFY